MKNMEVKHMEEMLEHLKKQNELFMEVYRSMSHDYQKLKMEEEMLMRKLCQVMLANGFATKIGKHD